MPSNAKPTYTMTEVDPSYMATLDNKFAAVYELGQATYIIPTILVQHILEINKVDKKSTNIINKPSGLSPREQALAFLSEVVKKGLSNTSLTETTRINAATVILENTKSGD